MFKRHRVRASFYHIVALIFLITTGLWCFNLISDSTSYIITAILFVVDYLAELYDPHPDKPGPWFKMHFHRFIKDEDEDELLLTSRRKEEDIREQSIAAIEKYFAETSDEQIEKDYLEIQTGIGPTIEEILTEEPNERLERDLLQDMSDNDSILQDRVFPNGSIQLSFESVTEGEDSAFNKMVRKRIEERRAEEGWGDLLQEQADLHKKFNNSCPRCEKYLEPNSTTIKAIEELEEEVKKDKKDKK